jgi:hypothetical protein
VQSHFEAQAHCYGDTALLNHPEEIELVDYEDLRGTRPYILFASDHSALSGKELAPMYDMVKSLSDEALAAMAKGIDIRLVAKGIFTLLPIRPQHVGRVDVHHHAELLRFRTRVAALVCPLPQIQKLLIHLNNTQPFMAVFKDNLQSELMAILDGRLDQYRSMIEFQLSSQKRDIGLASLHPW